MSRRSRIFICAFMAFFLMALPNARAESFSLCFGGFPQCAMDVDTGSIAPDAAIDEPGKRFARTKERLALQYGSLAFSRGLITMSPEHILSNLYAGSAEIEQIDLVSMGDENFAQMEQDGISKAIALPEVLGNVALPPYVAREEVAYAIPKYIRLPMLFLNEDAPEKWKTQVMNWVESETWTWEKLFSLAETVAAYNEDNKMDWVLLAQNGSTRTAPYFVQALCASGVQGNEAQEALLQTLEAYRAAENMSMVRDIRLDDEQPKALLELRFVTCVEMAGQAVLPLPAMEDIGLPRVATGQYFVLLAHAPHEEEALAFLQTYLEESMSYDVQSRMDYGLVRVVSYPYAVSTENIDKWESAMLEAALPDRKYLEAEAVLDAYLKGETTAQACVALLLP